MDILGCSAKQLWLLVRHGTRNPGDDDILDMKTRGVQIQESIIKNHAEGKGKTCLVYLTKKEHFLDEPNQHIYLLLFPRNTLGHLSEEKVKGIKAWTLDLNVEDEDLLTEAGRLELKQIGERYKKRLPTLFDPSAKVYSSFYHKNFR